MADAPRKKSPRAPSISLQDALERALKVYEHEGRHAAPTDAVAKDLGYKSASNGAALAVLASLRYYGLVERPKDGFLAVSEDVELYKYAPEEGLKKQLLRKWLKTPPVFSDLLNEYPTSLPSDPTLRFKLIQMGFLPTGADQTLSVFRSSVEFSRYFDSSEFQTKNEPPLEGGDQQYGTETEWPDRGIQTPQQPPLAVPPADDRFSVRIVGPGMDSTIVVAEVDDLDIVEVMLKKLRKKLGENRD